MVSFLFSWLLLFLLCTIKTNFLQDTLEPQKYKSKYFTGKKKKNTRKPCLRTIKVSEKYLTDLNLLESGYLPEMKLSF